MFNITIYNIKTETETMYQFSKEELKTYVIDNGYKKVEQEGGTFVVATFYNPNNGNYFSECVRDYDYSDCSRDNNFLYNMLIDKESQIAWKHDNGEILVNDTVEVYKGRKVPKGTIGKVVRIYPIKDRYRRTVATYVELDNGNTTNVENCRLAI